MSRLFATPINMGGLEILNFRVQNLSSAPGSPGVGQLYYDTTTGTLKLRNASAFFDQLDGGAVAQSKTGQLTLTGGLIVNTVGITGNKEINLTGTGASSVAGTFAATLLSSTGNTGATAGARFAGATASGAPASGTYLVGDFIIDRTGSIWICTGAGTPGTWTQLGGGVGTYNQTVQDNGTSRTQRPTFNVVSGTGTTGAATDDAGNTRTNISFSVVYGSISGSPSFGQSNANGVANSAARSDHSHALPAHDAAAHATIKISDLAAPTTSVSFGSQKITSLADGTANSDAATWGQVQGLIQGLDWKASVRVVATTNGTLASAYQNGSTVDGQTLATGDRILLAGQTAASENGIYTVNASGAPTRAADADASNEISRGTTVPVEAGTANGSTFWYCTATGANPWVPGSSTSTWSFLFTVTATQAGGGLTATGNVLAVGAGTGITVNTDDVTVNHAVVPYIYTTTVGDGSSTSITVTHNLGTRNVIVRVYQNSSTWDEIECDVLHATTNTVTLVFATAPSSNQYAVVVLG